MRLPLSFSRLSLRPLGGGRRFAVSLLLGVFGIIATTTTSPPAVAQVDHSEEAKEARRKAFAPWGAGTKRKVSRHGTRGRERVPHPFVGDPAKVPGEGPSAPGVKREADVPETALDRANRIGPSLSSNPLWLASLVYSNFLTRMDGPRCHHYPTCSRFGSQAVAKHKVMGLWLGLDRIIQPPVSSAIRGLPTVRVHGGSRSFDPLSNYEFWKPELFTGFPPATDEEPLVAPVVDEVQAESAHQQSAEPTPADATVPNANRASPSP